METFASIVVVVCAVMAYFETRLTIRNRKLRVKLRRALNDLRAFHMLEALYCEEASGGNLSFPPDVVTPLSIKRAMRAKLRAGGTEGPSDHATPNQIAQQLEALK